MKRIPLILLALLALTPIPARAGSASVAVASNFIGPMNALATAFGKETGHTLTISSGSTGKLYAQIGAGAPFDLFFSADDERPARLEAEGMMVVGSRFPYALGRLVMVSADPKGAVGPESLKGTGKIAVANPAIAPYGRAALQVMEKLGVKGYESRLVTGENVSQTLHFTLTGAAPVGFVALSQVKAAEGGVIGSSWIVPDDLYDPIVQACGLLKRGGRNKAAIAFLAFVKSDAGRRIVESFGYRAS
ncbi:MAG: molybdate ABC transporter substrate-binding protein [Nitrospinae bacterium]|nr:molybdate ABC transporter substrate-binding protein [Nitrospinota bacterium]